MKLNVPLIQQFCQTAIIQYKTTWNDTVNNCHKTAFEL